MQQKKQGQKYILFKTIYGINLINYLKNLLVQMYWTLENIVL